MLLLVMMVIQPCCPNVGFALLILFLLFLLCAADQVFAPKHVLQGNSTHSSSEKLGLAVSIGYGSFMRLHHKYSHLHGSSRAGLPMSDHHFSLLRSHDSLRRSRHRSHRRSFIDLQQEEEEEEEQSSSSSSSSFSAASFPLGGHANPYSAGYRKLLINGLHSCFLWSLVVPEALTVASKTVKDHKQLFFFIMIVVGGLDMNQKACNEAYI
jgi:hypothetical protein